MDRTYFQNFGRIFQEGIVSLIQNEIEEIDNLGIDQEILQQARHCNNLTNRMDKFQHEKYYVVENYILDNKNNCPFLITGSSGVGKSTLMGFIAKKVISK